MDLDLLMNSNLFGLRLDAKEDTQFQNTNQGLQMLLYSQLLLTLAQNRPAAALPLGSELTEQVSQVIEPTPTWSKPFERAISEDGSTVCDASSESDNSSVGSRIFRKGCAMEGCDKAARSRGFCSTHGGGARCSAPGCSKHVISNGRCRSHGGIIRKRSKCAVPGCTKARKTGGFCCAHGGGQRCKFVGCSKHVVQKGFCSNHFKQMKQAPHL